LFRYSTFLLYVCGGRNEYIDRSHIDGSAWIRFGSNRTEILPNLCSMRLESRKRPVPPAAMFKLIRRLLFGTFPLFLLLSGAPFHFFFGTPLSSGWLAPVPENGYLCKNQTYLLPGGQSDSFAPSNMRAHMSGLDIVFGSDIYSRLRAKVGAGG